MVTHRASGPTGGPASLLFLGILSCQDSTAVTQGSATSGPMPQRPWRPITAAMCRCAECCAPYAVRAGLSPRRGGGVADNGPNTGQKLNERIRPCRVPVLGPEAGR